MDAIDGLMKYDDIPLFGTNSINVQIKQFEF